VIHFTLTLLLHYLAKFKNLKQDVALTDVKLLARRAVLLWSYNYTVGGMTSSPGLRGWSCPQARHGVLQTTTTDAREQNNTALPYTV